MDFLLPGSLALAVIASGLVSLGIATAFERSYGVLKRLGGSPLPRWGLVAAKLVAVLALELLQVALLLAVADRRPRLAAPAGTSIAARSRSLLLGTLAFAGLGLLLAGTLRAEATLALANGLFLGFLMVGGHRPPGGSPAGAARRARRMPCRRAALADLFRAALGSATADPAGRSSSSPAWGAAAAGLAIRTFRWE